MADKNRIAGVRTVSVDDQLPITVAGQWTVDPCKVEREGLVGAGGVAGYKESPVVPFIEGEVFSIRGTSIEALQAITDATIQCELANGNSYVFHEAWSAGRNPINAIEGTISVRFEAIDVDELLAAEE